jgi:hypothetical protein
MRNLETMSSKFSLLSRAAAVAVAVAFALPALAQSNPPAAATPAAPAPSVAKQTSGDIDQKGEKKTHAKKDEKDHKQVAAKPATKTMEPAGTAKTDTGSNKQ